MRLLPPNPDDYGPDAYATAGAAYDAYQAACRAYDRTRALLRWARWVALPLLLTVALCLYARGA